MITPNAESLLKTLERLGYEIFDGDLNLIGVRKDYRASNRFDDTFCALYRQKGAWLIRHWPITTDPGWFHLENGLAKGTAVLKEGQYLSAYKIGRHQGKYPALVQVGPVTVWRDANRDHALDMARTETGLFGINIHRAGERQTSKQVDKWSAGCQVFADPDDFARLMELARAAPNSSGLFAYTLIGEADLL